MTATASPKRAGVVIKSVVTLVAVSLAAYVVWGLRGFIVPAFVGGLLAYICRPVVARLERGGTIALRWPPASFEVGYNTVCL